MPHLACGNFDSFACNISDDMKFSTLIIVSAFVVLVLGGSGSAQAGFIHSDPLASQQNSDLFLAAGGAGASQPANDSGLSKRLSLFDPALHQAAFAGLAGSLSGMSSQTVNGPSSAPPVALADDDDTSASGLVVWLTRMEESFHPRFIVSRLFRPPRS